MNFARVLLLALLAVFVGIRLYFRRTCEPHRRTARHETRERRLTTAMGLGCWSRTCCGRAAACPSPTFP